jgi:signal transduction histidine kinase
MKEIREQIIATKEDAVKILRKTSVGQRVEIKKIQYLVLLNSLALLVLTGFSLALLKRDAVFRRNIEEDLRRQRDFLEEQVQERTRELVDTNTRLQDEISERIQAESLIQEANNRFQVHEKMIQEQERLALSREVHDEIGQSLTALKLDLSWIKRRLPTGSGELVDMVEEMRGNLGRLIETTRQITSRLRPPLLDNLGLAAAIEWQVNDFRRRSGLECHVMLNEGMEIDDEQTSTSLLRILQESLTNVVRHAGATEVGVSLCRQGDAVVLEILDNGCGIAQDYMPAATSFGIMGMRERANLCGGNLSISGGPGKGTIVRCTIPVPAGKVDR